MSLPAIGFPRPASRVCCACALATLCLLAACDTTLAPFVDDGINPFALYGYLDADADTQFVRVVALRRTPERSEPVPDGITVTLFDAAGRARVWQDSVVMLDDGTRGLLFFSTDTVRAGAWYRLEATGAAGQRTTATTEVPPRYQGHVQPLAGDSLRGLRQDVRWEGLRVAPARSTVRYTLALPPDTFQIARDPSGDGLGGEGWFTTVGFSRDRPALLAALGRSETDLDVDLVGVEVTLEHRSAEWRASVREGETPLNIQNGRGFFGSRSTSRVTWTPAPEERRRLGYR